MQTKTPHFTSYDFSSEQHTQKQRTSSTVWIILVCVLFFLFLVISKRSQVVEFLGFGLQSSAISSGLVIGQQISLEGEISQDGDFITHTHKLYTLSTGVFGLKSKTVNLNQYSGTILAEGVVDSLHDTLYIIDVSRVISQLSYFSGSVQTGINQTGTTVSQGIYLPKAGIYFTPGFFSEYSLENSGENGSIKIKHLTTNASLQLNYSVCKKGDPNNDCTQLKNTFSSSPEKTFTTSNGDTYYKLAEVNSWFFTNMGIFGYFINDSSEQEVIALSNYLILPTSDYVKSTILPQISSLCKQGNIVMTTSKATTLYLEKGVPAVKISGTWEKGTAECKLILDLSLPALAVVSQFTYKDTSSLTGQSVSTSTPSTAGPSQVSSLAVQAGMKQFPITLDKTLTFTSTRGHSIIFPSKKISYQSSSISDDLGIAGLSCYVETNVTDYVNKDLIDTQPMVKIYECKAKGNITFPDYYHVFTLSDGRTFLAEALDPAWVDFVNNIQVTLN